jgi:hypothetical protein
MKKQETVRRKKTLNLVMGPKGVPDAKMNCLTDHREQNQLGMTMTFGLVKGNSDPRKTALARRSRNCKLQTHPLVSEDASHQPSSNGLTEEKIGHGPKTGDLTPGQTGRLTVGRNTTFTLTLDKPQ